MAGAPQMVTLWAPAWDTSAKVAGYLTPVATAERDAPMKKTFTVSVLALTVAALGVTFSQAQEATAPQPTDELMQVADRRGDDGDRWDRHGRDGGHRFERHGRHHGHYGEGRRGGGRHGARMMRHLQTFDANGDGAVTQAEIDQFRQDQISQFDADNNGTLSLEEYQALWLDQMRERMVDAFQRHDDDGSGEVTPEEFNERFSGLVERLDRNGDGQLSRDDRRGKRRGEPAQRPAAQADETSAPETAPATTTPAPRQ